MGEMSDLSGWDHLFAAVLFGVWITWAFGGVGVILWAAENRPWPLTAVLILTWAVVLSAPVAAMTPRKGDPL